MAKTVGSSQSLGGVAKSVGVSQDRRFQVKAVAPFSRPLGARPSPRGRGQGCGGVSKAVGAWPRP